MKTTIIIPVKNELKGLEELVGRLVRQIGEKDDIIFVDAGSDDGSHALLQQFAKQYSFINVLSAGEALPGKARNIGIRHTDAEIIAQIDGGNLPDPEWLKTITGPILSGKADYITGSIRFMPIINKNISVKIDWGQIFAASLFRSYREREYSLPAGGACVAFKKEIWQKAGGFPEWLRFGEDPVFVKKVLKQNIRHSFVKEAVVYWQVGPSFFNFLKRHVLNQGTRIRSFGDLRSSAHMISFYLCFLIMIIMTLYGKLFWWITVAFFCFAIARQTKKSINTFKRRNGDGHLHKGVILPVFFVIDGFGLMCKLFGILLALLQLPKSHKDYTTKVNLYLASQGSKDHEGMLYPAKKKAKVRLKQAWAGGGLSTGMADLKLKIVHLAHRSQTIRILLYHRVLPADKLKDVCSAPEIIVSQDTFLLQMKYLAANYTFVSLSDFLKFRQTKTLLPLKSVIITFDDGWEDNYNYAFPILNKFKVPATIFLTTDYINNNNVFWQEKLRFLIRKANLNQLQTWVSEIVTCPPPSQLPEIIKPALTSDLSNGINRLITLLKLLPRNTVNELISRLDKILKFPEFPLHAHSFLTWDQAREMADAGMEFGSHTRSHAMLPEVTTESIKNDLIMSKKTIEKKINHPADTFAYPGGFYDERVVSLVKNTGYTAALTIEQGFNTFTTDKFRLRRMNINESRYSDHNNRFSEKLFAASLSGWL